MSLFVLSVLVVACQPSNCQTTSKTAGITCEGKTPGDNCPAPKVRTCVSQCRDVVGDGGVCLVDVCDTGEGVICDRNLSCIPDAPGSRLGKCAPSRAECDPNAPSSDTNRCQAGTHCIPYVDLTIGPEGKRAHCPVPPALAGVSGMCVAFVPEGGACDSNAEPGESLPLEEADCQPCEPGTECVRLPSERTGTCLRRCDTSKVGASCPCEDKCVQATSVESGAPGNYCNHCVATKQACHTKDSDHTAECCNLDDTCFGDRCCRRTSKACKETGECCGTDKCQQGTCQACKTEGAGAQDAAECCAGLVLENVPGKGTVCSPSCGGYEQPCCLGTTCDGGMVCGGGKCQSCGGATQPCCSGNVCDASRVCTNGTCQWCGGPDQPCCSGNACGGGQVCANGTCQACGGPNQPCCSGNACGGGQVCANGTCQACGGANQACCGGNQCTGGATCTGGVCKPPPSCGTSGLACCPGAPCSDGSTCFNGKCEACGSDGQKCCGTANACPGKAAPGNDPKLPMVCLYADTAQERCATPKVTCGVKGTDCCLGLCDVGLVCTGGGCQ